MNATKPLFPDVIILDTRDIILKYKKEIEQQWLFSVDFEYIVANLVSAYYYVPQCNVALDETIDRIQIGFEDLRSDQATPLAIDYTMFIIKEIANALDMYLTTHGLLNYDYLPYRVESIIPDGAIVLRKFTQEDSPGL